MIKIIFKDVGQGDSIILEWLTEDILKVGIIDCKKHYNLNPVLDHVLALSISEIDFIVFTHPHSDHYSGLLEFLKEISIRKITVKIFFHCISFPPSYLDWGEIDLAGTNYLYDVLKMIDDCVKNGVIKNVQYLFCNSSYKICENADIFSLSPSPEENNYFMNGIEPLLKRQTPLKTCKYYANHLSTLFIFNYKEHKFIFTSDANQDSFKRILLMENNNLKNTSFNLCQLSHHGSKNNFCNEFWFELSKKKGCKAIISYGRNNYGHPSIEVINSLKKLGFTIATTQEKTLSVISSQEKEEVSALLDLFGETIIDEAQDLAFLFN